MGVLKIDHVQISIPHGKVAVALAFYESVLQFVRVDKPAERGGHALRIDDGPKGYKRASVFDPFGNRIELMQKQ